MGCVKRHLLNQQYKNTELKVSYINKELTLNNSAENERKGIPVRYVDPDGRTIQVYDYANNQRIAYEWKDYQGTWGFYDNNNTLYAGNNTFIGQLSGALTGLMNGGNAGFDLVSGLANHSNVVTLMYYTTHIENQLRSENSLPLRTYYGVDPSGNGIGPRIIVPSTGASRYYNSQGVTNYRPLGRRVAPYIY